MSTQCTNMLLLIERCSEAFAMKLTGRAGKDVEDALKRLDKLTREEAWMGIAENLRATHAVGESVRRIAENAVVIDNRVAGVSDRVASVDNAVKEVNVVVASVDDRVRMVGDRVAEVSRGA